MSEFLRPEALREIEIDNHGVWVNNLFLKQFGLLPFRKTYYGINSEKILKKLGISQHDERILFYDEVHEPNEIKSNDRQCLISYDNKIWLYFESFDDFQNDPTATLIFSHESDMNRVNDLAVIIRKNRAKKINEKRSMYIFQTNRAHQSEIVPFELKNQRTNLDKNYNDSLKPVYEILRKKLDSENDGGLVMLYGKPGTGKTSFIRHLATIVKSKMILLQAEDFLALSKPQLTRILSGYPNSILVIEDAEAIVQKRDGRGVSAVSSLLNLTDGLLTDYLKIKVICTFNSDLPQIDDALLRKGRLIMRYEFLPLAVNKSQALLKDLKCDHTPNETMTLSEIYHFAEENNFTTKKESKLGFK